MYFHNHGDPGPGIYLPSSWMANRASWQERGHTIPSHAWAATLVPLPAEGFYRVCEEFTCCEKACRVYEPDLLVQLGYDGDGHALLFVPELTASGLALPELGLPIDEDRLGKLAPLKVVESDEDQEPASDQLH